MKIKIESEFITLGQLLKILDYASSGGEVKYVIQTLHIIVNDQEENRRGKKLYSGDTIMIENKKYEIV